MKTAYILLVAGMLATSSALPARPQLPQEQWLLCSVEDPAYAILQKASGPLSEQLGTTISPAVLYQAYQDGSATITHLRFDGTYHYYWVTYLDGGVGIADVNEF